MLSPEAMIELFIHSARDGDMAIVEGVMGLYDGRNGLGSIGSTAEIAKWLSAPVILVVNVAGMSESAAAIALGYRQLDRAVDIAGVILNQVASPSHLRLVTEAIEKRAPCP